MLRANRDAVNTLCLPLGLRDTGLQIGRMKGKHLAFVALIIPIFFLVLVSHEGRFCCAPVVCAVEWLSVTLSVCSFGRTSKLFRLLGYSTSSAQGGRSRRVMVFRS